MKPKCLKKGDKVTIVSLSKGILGMPFCAHELELGIKRLKEYGLVPVFMDNALKDMEYLDAHPEARAADLKQAFLDNDIKAIICAVGGEDTYRTFEFLMEDEEFKEAVKNNPKIFTGYSDTTNNHLMLNKLGLSTFYGPCFLTDIAELDTEMLPYTKKYFEKFFSNGEPFELESSDYWYEDRTDFSPDALGTPRISHKEEHGFETLIGSGTRTGKLYGGCIESWYDIFTGETFEDIPDVYQKYDILPSNDEWKEKILFIETCEYKIEPEKLEIILNEFKKRNILSLVQGVIVGKPMDEAHYEEYKKIYQKVFSDIDTPVLYNLNFGHSFPRCILPYDAEVTVDYDNQKVYVNSKFLD